MYAEITTTVEEGRKHQMAALTGSPRSLGHVLGFAALSLQKAIQEGYHDKRQMAEFEALLQDVTDSLEELEILTTEPIARPALTTEQAYGGRASSPGEPAFITRRTRETTMTTKTTPGTLLAAAQAAYAEEQKEKQARDAAREARAQADERERRLRNAKRLAELLAKCLGLDVQPADELYAVGDVVLTLWTHRDGVSLVGYRVDGQTQNGEYQLLFKYINSLADLGGLIQGECTRRETAVTTLEERFPLPEDVDQTWPTDPKPTDPRQAAGPSTASRPRVDPADDPWA